MVRELLAIASFLAPPIGATERGVPPSGRQLVAIRVHPDRIILDGRDSRQQIVVDGVRADGKVSDVTPRAVFKGAHASSAFRIDPDGVLRPLRDGQSKLSVDVEGRRAHVEVTVRNAKQPAHWSFSNHIESVLSKQGCNMGACHGAGAGKGGLRLSLRAYDPESDHVRLRLEGSGRRIVKLNPDASLLLRKPSLAASHVGGLRLTRGSLEYRVLREWIAAGAQGPRPDDARVTDLVVYPADRVLDPGSSQQLQVTAKFSDGRSEDVTHWSRYMSNEDPIARVDDRGRVTMHGRGETAVSVWFLGKVAFARVAVPFKPNGSGELHQSSNAAAKAGRLTSIDTLIDAKLAKLGLKPSEPCSDGEFIRRAFLDTLGTLPTSDDARAFMADRSPSKRMKLVDALLERPELADYWTYRWADVLRINRDLIGAKGMSALYAWLRESIATNRPWDRIAYDLITATGPSGSSGPANFFRMGTKPEEFSETVSQTFLGVRVQCAHCHNHPFEKWTQSDYYRMANFFGRVNRKSVNGQEMVLCGESGEVEHPRLKRALPPAPFDGPTLSLAIPGDRREFLARWIVAPENPYFSRTQVNRLWKQLMGRGLIEPVDDIRLTNPASNEPLLDYLSKSFVRGGFDAKRLVREILLSRAYQRSANPTANNRMDDRFYSRYLPRRMPAEALLDAVCQVTDAPEKFGGMPAGTRAISLPDTRVANEFLDIFGRPARQITCECERNSEPNMSQALHLITAATLNTKIAAKDGALNRLVDSSKTDMQILEELYLSCFSRKPTAVERAAVEKELRRSTAGPTSEARTYRQQVFADLLWALISAPEFVYNH